MKLADPYQCTMYRHPVDTFTGIGDVTHEWFHPFGLITDTPVDTNSCILRCRGGDCRQKGKGYRRKDMHFASSQNICVPSCLFYLSLFSSVCLDWLFPTWKNIYVTFFFHLFFLFGMGLKASSEKKNFAYKLWGFITFWLFGFRLYISYIGRKLLISSF